MIDVFIVVQLTVVPHAFEKPYFFSIFLNFAPVSEANKDSVVKNQKSETRDFFWGTYLPVTFFTVQKSSAAQFMTRM